MRPVTLLGLNQCGPPSASVAAATRTRCPTPSVPIWVVAALPGGALLLDALRHAPRPLRVCLRAPARRPARHGRAHRRGGFPGPPDLPVAGKKQGPSYDSGALPAAVAGEKATMGQDAAIRSRASSEPS